jgi:hypothetical protein
MQTQASRVTQVTRRRGRFRFGTAAVATELEPEGTRPWAFAPYKTASSSSESMRKKRQPAGSSSPIPPRKSPRRARSLPSARILFSKYAGTEVNIEGAEHLIIREDDVLGVVE